MLASENSDVKTISSEPADRRVDHLWPAGDIVMQMPQLTQLCRLMPRQDVRGSENGNSGNRAKSPELKVSRFVTTWRCMAATNRAS